MDKTRFENLEKKIEELTKLLRNHLSIGDWIPRESIKYFFDYGDTQLKNLSKDPIIITSRVKNRVFFKKDSIIAFIERHKKKGLV
jgi:hypothetical protein